MVRGRGDLPGGNGHKANCSVPMGCGKGYVTFRCDSMLRISGQFQKYSEGAGDVLNLIKGPCEGPSTHKDSDASIALLTHV
ncbi:hypothetical protein J6590_060422 [Homalodisca vitripennis]|nr:hypothetical protein J6590_060422 [Homalodisca vitripennis]